MKPFNAQYEVPREFWLEGPWTNELDEYEWKAAESFYDCAVLRGPMRQWNGYVGIPLDHPLSSLKYDIVQERADINRDLDELTFSRQIGDLYWVGFDLCHVGDLTPTIDSAAYMESINPGKPKEYYQTLSNMFNMPWVFADATYKDMDYAIRATNDWAKALYDAEPSR